MRRFGGMALLALAACQAAPSPEELRLASPSPEIASCGEWFRALDRQVDAAGVRDLEYSPVPGFPYLRLDPFLAQSRTRAARGPAAFAALADRMLEHDLEARRYELANLPAADVEKWSGMRSDESLSAALRRSLQCGRLLRDEELARPQTRAALLGALRLEDAPAMGGACSYSRGEGALVRYAPPPAAASRPQVAGWLLRGEVDPLGEPLVSERELGDIAAAYAPSLEVVVASDADRFGALRWRRGATNPEIDATEPAVYVGHGYARYEDRGLLQIVYTALFPRDRITWRVTLAPDGEPLVYEAAAGDGCRAVFLTPRARLRGSAQAPRLAGVADGARPLLAVAAGTHEIAVPGLVHGSDSLARYTLRRYDELRSGPTPEGRNRAAAGRPVFTDAQPLEARFAFDLPEPRP